MSPSWDCGLPCPRYSLPSWGGGLQHCTLPPQAPSPPLGPVPSDGHSACERVDPARAATWPPGPSLLPAHGSSAALPPGPGPAGPAAVLPFTREAVGVTEHPEDDRLVGSLCSHGCPGAVQAGQRPHSGPDMRQHLTVEGRPGDASGLMVLREQGQQQPGTSRRPQGHAAVTCLCLPCLVTTRCSG